MPRRSLTTQSIRWPRPRTARFAALEVRFERIDGKFNLLFWMQGMTIACVVIPLIRDFIG